ncbi:2-hydroxymuconate tautomerase [Viridibacillus sp. FSL R5-0477]|uniref:Tautomerase n=1 Tax=Viridibacillus arenosi FSL R5-213 TaxID=1227360 RepID=W4F440_9BACL|nr:MULTISPECIES: 2-hydroxymuconate tautomerase [Viridibacillus]ETT87249.1 4-oxalocrotonate tautomerase [Viridibacillus arenosi FSL R5-213]OMC80150.1 4-oxalocrotonate tautomerase [Viridibacillus sp. FSL H8-0123]OMC87920.1 4-oxalocrotonate tautomerase [Viridibacillus sp. FSL H7-0596]OMC91471.1 4-oxalocrotonate tautomerase [Viridibacillus arenosi]
MPIVTIKMIEGRTDDQKRDLVEKVTAAISESVDAPKENISIIIEEMQKSHFAIGGVRKSDL